MKSKIQRYRIFNSVWYTFQWIGNHYNTTSTDPFWQNTAGIIDFDTQDDFSGDYTFVEMTDLLDNYRLKQFKDFSFTNGFAPIYPTSITKWASVRGNIQYPPNSNVFSSSDNSGKKFRITRRTS